jgi:hypothetical protein
VLNQLVHKHDVNFLIYLALVDWRMLNMSSRDVTLCSVAAALRVHSASFEDAFFTLSISNPTDKFVECCEALHKNLVKMQESEAAIAKRKFDRMSK